MRFVRDHGPSSRHDIARGCGLGISTMTDLVGELRSRRLVRELEPVRRPGAGRPTRPIALDGEPWCVLGAHIDLDQVEFSVATVGGRELWQDTVRLDRPPGGEVDLLVLRELLSAQLARLPADKALVAIEVGLPGFVSADGGTVSWSADLGWRDLPLRTLLARYLSDRGIHDVHVGVTNDAQLAALYAVRIELDGPSVSVAVHFGGRRNIGGAVIVDGEIFRGAHGAAGDLAHLNVDPDGPPHRCGRRGCLESLVGIRQLLVTAELASVDEADQLVATNPERAVQLIAEGEGSGSRGSPSLLAEASAALGRAIDDVVATTNPDVVVLAGYLGVLGPLLVSSMEPVLSLRLDLAAFAATRVVSLESSDHHAVLGAALTARDACLYDPLTWTKPVAV